MRNLNIICVEEDYVAWSASNKTTNISASRENQSNVILDQIQKWKYWQTLAGVL